MFEYGGFYKLKTPKFGFLILILKCKRESLCTNEIQSDHTHIHSVSHTHTVLYSEHRRRLLQSLSKNAGNHSCKHQPKQKGMLLVSERPVFTWRLQLLDGVGCWDQWKRERKEKNRTLMSSLPLCSPSLLSSIKPSLQHLALILLYAPPSLNCLA